MGFLPVSIRKYLSIDTGDKLVAYASGDVIMLKTLKLPSAEELEFSLKSFHDNSILNPVPTMAVYKHFPKVWKDG